jgi:uncharacterized membrane protein
MVLFDSTNPSVYEPLYIPLLLLFLGIMYLVYFGLVISKVRLDALTMSTLATSFLIYLLIGVYMVGGGYHADDKDSLVFESYGFLELILLAFPYGFLSLAAGLGEKRNR